MNDTIAAYSGGVLPAAIGICRVSGPAAFAVADRLFRPKKGGPMGGGPFYTMRYGDVLDSDGRTLDLCLACCYKGPNSYTGEDMLEIFCHGSQAVVARILDRAAAEGARPAKAGEFTQRAFLAGKMDLTGAEAVADLLYAPSAAAAKNAAAQLKGGIARQIRGMRDVLMGQITHFYAVCDYPDEDLDPFMNEEACRVLTDCAAAMDKLCAGFERGRVLAEGLPVTILGRPNAGKSSLLNALAGYERAIVTPIPGTTRDTVEATVTLEGYLFRLVDTAGLRDSDDPIEQLGVARSRQALDQADLILLVCDGTQEMGEEDTALLDQALDQADTLLVMNKSDLPGYGCPMFRAEDTAHTLSVVGLSAKTGLGLEFLEEELVRRAQALLPQAGQRASELLLTNQRQTDAVRRAAESVARAGQALEQGVTPDALLTDVEQAMAALGELTGRTVREDITSRIFQRFCVGK